jgi:hypothetical protein
MSMRIRYSDEALLRMRERQITAYQPDLARWSPDFRTRVRR